MEVKLKQVGMALSVIGLALGLWFLLGSINSINTLLTFYGGGSSSYSQTSQLMVVQSMSNGVQSLLYFLAALIVMMFGETLILYEGAGRQQ